MDYDSIHGPGRSNFSSEDSLHRMPTVSAAQAFKELSSKVGRFISTGIAALDLGLQNRDPSDELDEGGEGEELEEGEDGVGGRKSGRFGGVSRGKVTEIWGPPGSGKTGLGMHLAANALWNGDEVMWIDASHPLPSLRFHHILDSLFQTNKSSFSQTPSQTRTPATALESLTHYSTPTLAHLLAIFSHPTPNHPSPRTSLIIIDSFSTLVSTAFPRNTEPPPQSSDKKPRGPKPSNPSSRKFPILQHLLANLQKIAATRNIAIVIFSQCVTKMRPGIGAVLVPAINVTAWDQGLATRVVLFRDWGWDDEGEGDGGRLAMVMKAEGVSLPEGRGWLVGFRIDETGLHSLPLPKFSTITPAVHPFNPRYTHQPHSLPQHMRILPQKRKREYNDLEIPDSEGEDDEDYGWAEEDEGEVLIMPPQWQGSEDILIPDPKEKELEVEEEGEELGDEEDEIHEEYMADDVVDAEILDSGDELAL